MKAGESVMLIGVSPRLLTTLFLAIAVYAQSQPSDRATLIASAQKKAVKAVSFRQCDGVSLKRARVDFTPEGWKSFIDHMQGFLDKKGAPTFTSSFVAAKEPVFLDESNGVVHFRIPGTLTQTQGASRTTYRAALDVYALRDLMVHGGSSIKIQHLEQITCAGASSVCQ
jgi:hypothetical protein